MYSVATKTYLVIRQQHPAFQKIVRVNWWLYPSMFFSFRLKLPFCFNTIYTLYCKFWYGHICYWICSVLWNSDFRVLDFHPNGSFESSQLRNKRKKIENFKFELETWYKGKYLIAVREIFNGNLRYKLQKQHIEKRDAVPKQVQKVQPQKKRKKKKNAN